MSDKTITEKIEAIAPATNIPFTITKIGHIVLGCRDLERSVKFYTQILGFKVSDIYEPDMVPGGMVFMRFGVDHHGVGLVGAMPSKAENIELHHLAFEVASLDELLRVREHLEKSNVPIDFHGRRRAGGQIAVEFTDLYGERIFARVAELLAPQLPRLLVPQPQLGVPLATTPGPLDATA